MMLEAVFRELLSNYTSDEKLVKNYWLALESAFSGPRRHYHTLKHLENVYVELLNCKEKLNDWNAIMFALFYHDYVYNVLRSDNEEQSATQAEAVMASLRIPAEMIHTTVGHIRATQRHSFESNSDTNYFTDADLSILGASWEIYHQYTLKVREEYSIFSDLVYKPGRRKVLNHFLQMERIFKTDYFHDRYEMIARNNLQNELALL